MIVPGLAFTKSGQRLGRGGGFYDRLLSRYSGKSLGICFHEQVKAELPLQAHDHRVSEVLAC